MVNNEKKKEAKVVRPLEVMTLEEKLGQKTDTKKPFATWLLRWAGEILTKYTPGPDGKTPWERRRGDRCGKALDTDDRH